MYFAFLEIFSSFPALFAPQQTSCCLKACSYDHKTGKDMKVSAVRKSHMSTLCGVKFNRHVKLKVNFNAEWHCCALRKETENMKTEARGGGRGSCT